MTDDNFERRLQNSVHEIDAVLERMQPAPALDRWSVEPHRKSWWRAPAVLLAGLAAAGTAAVGTLALTSHTSPVTATHSTPTLRLSSPAASAVPASSPGPGSPQASATPAPSHAVTTATPKASASPTAVPVVPTWPGPSNTGVPGGTQLASSSGVVTLATAHMTYDAQQLNGGCIHVTASNVTISRVLIRGAVDQCGGYVIDIDSGVTGTVVRDTEVDGQGHPTSVAAVGGGALTCLRCNIHNTSTAFWATSGTLQSSWVHDLVGTPKGDVLIQGGDGGITVQHNTLDNPTGNDGVVYIDTTWGPVSHVVIDDNLLSGGGSAIYGGGAQASYIQVTNNHFSRARFPKCGYYGWDSYYDVGQPGNTWSGNVWDDTGQTVSPQ